MNPDQRATIESYNKTAINYASTIGKLENYYGTYDELLNLIPNNGSVLDLACGPGTVSKYLLQKKTLQITGVDLSEKMLQIAQSEIPNGIFYQKSIIEYQDNCFYDAVILSFALPYLDPSQAQVCLAHATARLKNRGAIYLSFMEGSGCQIEKTSFGGANPFLIHYHSKKIIMETVQNLGLLIEKEFEIDYQESDGTISKDVILIAQNRR